MNSPTGRRRGDCRPKLTAGTSKARSFAFTYRVGNRPLRSSERPALLLSTLAFIRQTSSQPNRALQRAQPPSSSSSQPAPRPALKCPRTGHSCPQAGRAVAEMPTGPHISPAFAHGIGMRRTRCSSEEEPGAIGLLCVRSAEQEGAARGPGGAGIPISNSCQARTGTLSSVTSLSHRTKEALSSCQDSGARGRGKQQRKVRLGQRGEGPSRPAPGCTGLPGSGRRLCGKTRQPPAPTGAAPPVGQ